MPVKMCTSERQDDINIPSTDTVQDPLSIPRRKLQESTQEARVSPIAKVRRARRGPGEHRDGSEGDGACHGKEIRWGTEEHTACSGFKLTMLLGSLVVGVTVTVSSAVLGSLPVVLTVLHRVALL